MSSAVDPLQFPQVAAFAKTQTGALAELIAISKETIRFGDSLRSVNATRLNARPGPKRWSALECLDHLNRYADHYLPLLQARQVLAKAEKSEAYRSGLLGKPFALAMHPARRHKRLNSPAKMNPLGSALDAGTVVEAFRQNQLRYLQVLEQLRSRELSGNRIAISAFPIVKLSLGDMLHTLVWHNMRHALQAAEALQA